MIRVEKTAITTGISKSARLLKDNHTNGLILDYGCGKLRNTKYLLDSKFKIYIHDTDLQLDNIKENIPKEVSVLKNETNFDSILCSFVLNVIPSINERISLIHNIEKLLSENGYVYFEVRKPDFINKSKTARTYNDGYILGSTKFKTFQKAYDKKELSQFIIDNSSLKIENLIDQPNSIIAICTKKSDSI